jgi:hypothetical protein
MMSYFYSVRDRQVYIPWPTSIFCNDTNIYLPPLSGVIGDSNVPCSNTTSTTGGLAPGGLGASCTSSSNCLYNICTDQTCGVQILICPTNLPGE